MGTDAQAILRVAIPVGAMIVVLLVAGIGLFLYRRTLFGNDRSMPGTHASSVLESLRHLRDNGEISEDEYRTAKHNIVAKAAGLGRTGLSKAKGRTMPQAQPQSQKTNSLRTNRSIQGELRAMPGFDLTGEPLPDPGQADQTQE